jgi:tetrahydromethanopterin S-methyltransferase subunit A
MSEPGFTAGNIESPIAICTLSSTALLGELAASSIASRVAIIGPLETENIGIERMVTTLLERPRIRFLIVCGADRRGPYQAQALQALFTNGLESDGRIAGARGRRARLPTLTAEHIDAVRQQVRLVDLVGSVDLETIRGAVERCWAEDPGPFEPVISTPLPPPILVPRTPFRLKEHDPNGFFVILVDKAADGILVEHYQPSGALAHRILGPDAESLCVALVDWGLVSLKDHAAYLGRELTKAEFALRHGLAYRQDEPL